MDFYNLKLAVSIFLTLAVLRNAAVRLARSQAKRNLISIKTNFQEPRFRDYQKWKILGFTDHSYAPIAVKWYENLQKLGYKNHFIIALDYTAYKYAVKHDCRSELAEIASNSTRNFKSNLWQTRIDVVGQQLGMGFDVLVSDIDSIWLRKFALEKLPEKYDLYNSYGHNFPKEIYNKQGFVFCGCFIAFRNTNETKKFVQKWSEKCQTRTHCDDQRELNLLLRYFYKMKYGGNIGHSKKFDLKIFNFNRNTILRQSHGCDSNTVQNSWVLMPPAAKNATLKQKMLQRYGNCSKAESRSISPTLMYNKFPKAASSYLKLLFEKLAVHNGVKTFSFNGNRNFFDINLTKNITIEVLKPRIVDNFLTRKLVIQHFPYMKIKKVRYINFIRHPIDWFVSNFYFGLNGWNKSSTNNEGPQIYNDIEPGDTIDDCVEKKRYYCSVNPVRYFEYFAGLLGHPNKANDYLGYGVTRLPRNYTDHLVNTAIQNVRKDFAFVGVYEHLHISLLLLEKKFPEYFHGYSWIYKNKDLVHLSENTKTNKKTTPKNSTEKYLLNFLDPQLKLYNSVLEIFKQKALKYNLVL